MQYRNVIVALIYGMTGTSFTHHPSRTCTEQTQMNMAQPLSSRSLLVQGKKKWRLWGRGCFPASPQRKWLPKKCNLGMQGREEEGLHPVRYEAILHARELVPVNTQNHACCGALLFLWHQWGNQGSERFSNLPKVTQLYMTEATFEPGLLDCI